MPLSKLSASASPSDFSSNSSTCKETTGYVKYHRPVTGYQAELFSDGLMVQGRSTTTTIGAHARSTSSVVALSSLVPPKASRFLMRPTSVGPYSTSKSRAADVFLFFFFALSFRRFSGASFLVRYSTLQSGQLPIKKHDT